MEWEFFKDETYYNMWCVKPKEDTRYGVGFHVSNGNEAELLKKTLNKYKVKVDFKTEQKE